MATSARLDELKKKFDENPRRYFAPLANEYRKLGDLTQAIALCRAHLPNQPGHISGHIVLAQALYEARELGEARGIFEAALDLDPENLIALRYLGDIAREQGEPVQARAWFERVLDADPRNDEIAQLLRDLEAESAHADARFAPPVEDHPPAVASAHFSAGAIDTSFVTPPSVDSFAASAFASEPEAAPEPHDPIETPTFVASIDASVADPFFGEETSAPALPPGELEAVAEPSVDDWFALPADAPTTPARESAPLTTSVAESFDDSFFPNLTDVTPVSTPAVAAGRSTDDSATPSFELDEAAPTVDTGAPTPPFVVAQSAPHASVPTPPFLEAVESEVEFDAWTAPVLERDAREEETVPLAETVSELRAPEPAQPTELLDEVTLDVAADVSGTAEAVQASVPDAFEPQAWETSEETMAAASAELSYESGPVAEEPAAPAMSLDGMETSEDLFADVQSLSQEPSDDLEMEYGEFVAPANEAIPFIANSISVPLDQPDAYSSGAPDLSAHEPFPLEREYRSDDLIPSAPTPPWSEALAVSPVDGLVSRDVPAEPEPATAAYEEEVIASTSTEGASFVTETMAELYLQQGFTEEALSIYRQLLAQQPGDRSIADRIAALEHGAHSAVVQGLAPRDASDRVGQSVRTFFAHFARRQPRRRGESRRLGDEGDASEPHGSETPDADFHPAVRDESSRFSGVATRDEAMTVPDEPSAAAVSATQGAASISQLFANGAVSRADEAAASTLAGAFASDDHPSAGRPTEGRSGEGQLSLEHLFRDVQSRSSGAVTLDEFYDGSANAASPPVSGGAVEEHDADIEQFTAWLEGLKKK